MSGCPQRLASVTDLSEGATRKFRYRQDGIERNGFLAQFHGKLLAYENICRHHPVPLEYGDGRFFDMDGRHFICQTHGAIYEPMSGECLRGPCQGASLKALRIEVKEGAVWLLDQDTI